MRLGRGAKAKPHATRRERAAHGKQHADQQLFGKDAANAPAHASCHGACVNAREVGKRSHGQHRIAFANAKRHAVQRDGRRCTGRRHGHGRQKPAVPPVEEMTLPELAAPAAQAGARIEQAVPDIDSPDDEHLQRQNP